MSVDGTPISQADLARIQAEEALHAEQQRQAVKVIASASQNVDDCRMLLSMLGLDAPVVSAARTELVALHQPAAKRSRKRHAA